MDGRSPEADEQPSRLGYIFAIVLSALGHAVAIALAFFVLPAYFHQQKPPLPAYSVKIVDQLPAGDLGTHLPKLSSRRQPPPAQETKPEPPKPEPEKPKVVPPPEPPPPRLAREPDKNAIALNTIHSPTPQPTVPPTPQPKEPTPTPTPEPTRVVTPQATPPPTPAPTKAAPKPTSRPKPKPKPKPTPKRTEHKKKEAKPQVEIAKAEQKPSVEDQLRKVREQLLAQHLASEKKSAEQEDEGENEESSVESKPGPSGGGPVVANTAIEGKGAGIGPGSGSAGIQKDPEFLLYYRMVQERVKKAWNFSGGSGDLSTTVTFAIGADGNLTGVRITQSSHDSAFDDSVVRAIKRAAPFPAPPENYRSQFAEGIEAVFRLGELSS